MHISSLGRLTDEEIARRVQSGKIEEFGVLVKRYEPKMMRYARKFLFGYEETEDLVQDVFVKAYINIQSFDTSKKFSAWLYRIAHNEFINAIKKKGKEPLSFFNFDILFSPPVSKQSADKHTNEHELRQVLDKCLGKLNPKYREVLVLYYFESLSYQEIADVLHIPISTVGVRIKRAKKTMKTLCQKLDYYL